MVKLTIRILGQCKIAVVKNKQYKNKLLKTEPFQALKWNGDFQIAISLLYVYGDLEIAVPFH